MFPSTKAKVHQKSGTCSGRLWQSAQKTRLHAGSDKGLTQWSYRTVSICQRVFTMITTMHSTFAYEFSLQEVGLVKSMRQGLVCRILKGDCSAVEHNVWFSHHSFITPIVIDAKREQHIISEQADPGLHFLRMTNWPAAFKSMHLLGPCLGQLRRCEPNPTTPDDSSKGIIAAVSVCSSISSMSFRRPSWSSWLMRPCLPHMSLACVDPEPAHGQQAHHCMP